MLELRGVAAGYGSVQAIRDVSLDVPAGSIVAIIGPNGAGKTTTLKTIVGLLKPRAGSISFLGRPIADLPPPRIVEQGISLVPEGRKIFAELTVEENLLIGAITRPKGPELRQDLDRMFTLFPRLAERRAQLGGTLSGGEQQMLAVARGLMSRPKLLMLDEPSLGLAPIVVERVFNLILDINADGTTVLLVEQDAQMALAVADQGYVLETGRIVLDAPADALLGNEDVRRSYLGLERVEA
jgi:branched-chain amino acid transport system ATP-binding protein